MFRNYRSGRGNIEWTVSRVNIKAVHIFRMVALRIYSLSNECKSEFPQTNWTFQFRVSAPTVKQFREREAAGNQSGRHAAGGQVSLADHLGYVEVQGFADECSSGFRNLYE